MRKQEGEREMRRDRVSRRETGEVGGYGQDMSVRNGEEVEKGKTLLLFHSREEA